MYADSKMGQGRERGEDHSWVRLCLVVSVFVFFSIPVSYAEFSLNFVPDDGTYSNNDAYVSCGMSYLPDANCSQGGRSGGFDLNGSHDDNTAFYQRMFTDPAGNTYYQVMVGDHLVDDFAQEYIVQANASEDGYWDAGIARSASAGDPADRLYNMDRPYDVDGSLSSSTGTGSGNPTRVIMRQLVTDNTYTTMEFLKDKFANKPLITQLTEDPEFTSYFEVDMRDKVYSDITPVSPLTHMINSLTLIGADKQGTEGDFEYTAMVDKSHFNAGGYTYQEGSSYGGSLGLYTYVGDGSAAEWQPIDKDYSKYCDPVQNTDWSGFGACTNGDGTGGTGGGFNWGRGGGMRGL